MAVPDFIVRLREKIGHDPLWLIGATAVVLRDTDVLLVRRADNGRWTPVTGVVDPGEHPAETAVRECHEETGVVVEVEGLAWVHVLAPMVVPNGDHAQFLDHTLRCRYVSGEAHVADEESTDVRWWPLAALPQLPTDMVRRIEAAVSWDGGPARI